MRAETRKAQSIAFRFAVGVVSVVFWQDFIGQAQHTFEQHDVGISAVARIRGSPTNRRSRRGHDRLNRPHSGRR